MEKIILKDKTEIEIVGGGLHGIKCEFHDQEARDAAIDALTKENLKEVEVKNANGDVLATYKNLVFVSETSMKDVDENGDETGTIKTIICLREQTEIEKRLNKLEESQSIQDGAIEELAMMAADGDAAITETSEPVEEHEKNTTETSGHVEESTDEVAAKDGETENALEE